MGLLKSLVSTRERDVDRSDSGSDDFLPPTARLQTIYSGISVSFTTQVTLTQRTGWKPFSLRAPVLCSFIIVSLALIALVEYLAQQSLKQGGLSLSTNTDRSTSVLIYSQYAPTVIAVLYSLVWTWIDLDIRRIQPWIELSRPEGAQAESTLLLDYPFEFLAFIPLKAWKRKHWQVFLAGTIMMIVFWAVTPLQSAIFGLQTVVVTKTVSMADTARFATLGQQLDVLDASVLQDAYAMTWLGQPLPGFTTSDHAFVPFEPVAQGSDVLPEETWTTTATALSTDLDCWPAVVTDTAITGTFGFDNGRGCSAELALNIRPVSGNGTNIKYTIIYVGYHEEAHLDWFLENPNCSQAASHQFLAIWTSTRSTNLTALFCEPSYQKQTVSVRMSAQDRRPQETSILPVGEAVAVAPEEFNTTAFEYLLGTGLASKQMRRDYPRDRVIDQYATAKDTRLAFPLTNMVGFALGLKNATLDDLQNATVLQHTFASAHKLIFSAAMPQLMTAVESPTSPRSGTVQYTLYGVVVSRPISLVVEALLGFIAVLVAAILYLTCRTHSTLARDPGGLAATLGIFRESRLLLNDFAPKDQYDEDTLRKSVQGNRYRLVDVPSLRGPGLQIETLIKQSDSQGLDEQPNTRHDIGKATQHKALKPLSGGLFVVTLLSGIAVLSYLKRQEQLLGGLPRPTENFEVLQILENYVPTIFATLVEPFLVLLNRLRCVLQPFHDLRQGHKSAKRTFETSYTTIPPQLAVFKALMSGHVLLTGLCVMSLLANILAIALGGLFNEAPVFVSYNTTLQQSQIPILNRTVIDQSNVPAGFYDHFYVTMANLSSGTRLTPWTDAGFTYFPFSAAGDGHDNSSLIYRAKTRGFGIEAVCSEIGTSPESLPYANYSQGDDGSSRLDIMVQNEDGSVALCSPFAAPMRSSRLNISAPVIPGPLAQEVATSLRNLSSDGKPGLCERHLILSWMRIDPSDREGSLKATYVHCTSLLRTAIFSVAVDSSGYVLESTRVGDFENLTTISANETALLLTSGADVVGSGAAVLGDSTSITLEDASWHNDTLTRDWFNYFLKLMANSTSLVDPQQGLPNATRMVPAVKDMYQRLFSVALGLNMGGVFKTSDIPARIEGTMTVEETRIFMDDTAFIITIVILCLNVLVVTVLYVQESSPFLPRLPSTIGSLLAYVAASRAVREHKECEEMTGKAHRGMAATATYSFGKFVGIDGKEHVGVELDPFVVSAGDAGSLRLRNWFVRPKPRNRSMSPKGHF
ncbi:hypothetical protein BR93DRAFT_976515 [Coniochaeta sp. PMI_546]|nr:hypothetical protein BR93DRAFT_976515 [Coniochaeta sp. PMI_546]